MPDTIVFRHQEPETVRVPKLNKVVALAEAGGSGGGGGGGGTTLEIDGGDAYNSGVPYIAVDGGSA